MLIIPIHKKVTTRNFPAITALLVLINCLVFFLLQTGDDQVFEEALEYYFESVLPDIELPLYRQYLIDSGRDDPTEEYSFPEGDTSRNHYLLISMESDPEFMKALNTGLVVSPAEPDYDRWKRSRDTYEQLRESSFTQHYLLHYDEFNPVNSFTHMFMHGGMGHLLGNMLFLILLGILVEGALGGGLFLAAYLVAGLTAAVASLLIHWGDAGGMLGASGAIAGLMGLYTVLYGKRKVRFFYWFFVFFDYVKKPAIILLPLWLGWELIQFFFGGYGVAYEAHIGGIIGGVLLGLGILKLGWENRDFLDEETRRDHDRDLFSEAMDDLKELRVDAARQKLKQLLPQHGRDLELLKRYYNTCKLQPEHPDFHDAARRVLLHTDQGTEQNTLIRDTFRDYARTAKGKIRLSQSERETLTIRLANWGYLQEAGLLANALLKQANPSPESAEAILALGHACSVQGNPSNAKHYLLQIIQRFPSSREAVTARDLLKSLDPQAR